MSRRRHQPPEPSPQLAEITSLLTELGGILMGIDAKLETIIALMEEDDELGD